MEERERILKLLEEGKITADQAAKLLEALGETYRWGPKGHAGFGPDFGERIARKVELKLKDLPELISTSISGMGFITGEGEEKDLLFNPKDNIVIKAVSGDVTIKGDEDANIRIKVEGGHRVNETEKELTIKTMSGDMFVQVPATQKMILKAASGDVKVERIADISLRSASGEIDISNITERTAASLGSGDIRLEYIKGAMAISLGSGDLDAENISASLTISMGSGDINLDLEECKGGRIELGSGDLDLSLPEDADVEITIHKNKDSDIDSDFDLIKTDYEPAFDMEEYKITVGKPKTKLYIKAREGDIAIHKRRNI